MLEDLKEYDKALQYISTLDFLEAENSVKNYGKILVSNIPEQTTNFLMKLCSNYAKKGEEKEVANLPLDRRQRGLK